MLQYYNLCLIRFIYYLHIYDSAHGEGHMYYMSRGSSPYRRVSGIYNTTHIYVCIIYVSPNQIYSELRDYVYIYIHTTCIYNT